MDRSSSSSSSSSLSRQSCDDDDDEIPLPPPLLGLALEESLSKIESLMTMTTQQVEQDQDHNDNASSWNTLFRFCQNAVYVGPSSIPDAGMGLFASHPLEANQIVSFYPVHGIGIGIVDGSRNNNIAMACLREMDREYFDQQEEDSPNNYRQYLLGNRPIGTLSATYNNNNNDNKNKNNNNKAPSRLPPMLIDVNANRPLQKGWMSHCVNDGAAIISSSSPVPTRDEKNNNNNNDNTNHEIIIQEYYTKSLQKQNCVQIPFGPFPLVATVTTKPIHNKGEELFTCYEHPYWLTSQQNDDKDGEADGGGTRLEGGEQQKSNHLLLKATIELAQTHYNNVLEDLVGLYSRLL